MRKLLLGILFLIFPFLGFAQYKWDFGFQGGGSNYLGEMGGKADTSKSFLMDMKLSQTHANAGGFARYKFTPLLSARVAFNWIRISGADNKSTNPGRVGRNLSFRNDLMELELTGQVFFYEISDLGHTYQYNNDFKMYAFGGVSGFYNHPKAMYDGNWVALRPLQTEGKKYKAIDIAIPLGIGFLFTVNRRHRIGWEFNWRTTFTDYIDDVSKVYVPNEALSSPEAIALANRRNELGQVDPELVPAPENYGYDYGRGVGNRRGDPSHNDSYITTSVYYSYVLRGKSSFYKSKYGSVFKRSKYKKRKIRAKF